MTPRSSAHLTPIQLTLICVLTLSFAAGWYDIYKLTAVQAPGADFSCVWAGAKAALADASRVYDFEHVSALQGWPLGAGRIRPYIYPPTALFLFVPFALPPYWAGFGLWVGLTGGLFLWASRRIGAPWWLVATMPVVMLVAQCGQLTFLIGGLVLAALSLGRRPLLAGVLFGLAAAVKPQFLILVPVALVAEGRWRTLIAAGATGLALCLAATLAWGPQRWWGWVDALSRFRDLIFHDRGLTEDAITPYAALVGFGRDGAWAFLLAPVAVALVWFGFRRTRDLADRSLLLFGATILVTPYAMNYELALLAPGVAIYLSRLGDPRWPRYAAAALGFVMLPWAFPALLPALALPAASLLRPSLTRDDARAALTSNPGA